MNNETIATIIGALGVGTWAGNVIQKYIEAKNKENLQRLQNEGGNNQDKQTIKDLQDDVEDLTEEKEKLKIVIEEFKLKVTELETTLVESNADRARAEQQLATINVAFDMIYTQLRRMVGDRADGQELLAQLKTYIDGNTNRNIT